MRRSSLPIRVISFVALLSLLLLSLVIKAAISPVDANGKHVSVILLPGTTFSEVATKLAAKKLIHRRAFTFFARVRQLDSKVRSGEYSLSPSMSSWEILTILSRGQVLTYKISIPEGLKASQIANRLHEAQIVEAADFLEGVHNIAWLQEHGLEGSSYEGYLFPETYTFSKGLPVKTVLKTFAAQFHDRWKRLESKAKNTGLNMREIVILASIIEKETGQSSERPRIASVFLNRLAKGIRLQTDPTVIYGIKTFDGNLTRRHLNDSTNPYNTYQFSGLPPGPISNPGEASLRSVVEPEITKFLYFVARGDGSHEFTQTYRDHLKAVEKYQIRRSNLNKK